MKYIVGGTPTFTIAEHNVPTAGAIDPDASSALGAITVGAVNHATNATPESFSSRGPAFRLFDDNGVRLGAPEVRPKPDIAGRRRRVDHGPPASSRSSAPAPPRRAWPASPR